MREVNVKRTELLDKVKANREAHRGLFLKAQEGFKKAVLEALEKSLDDARSGKKFNNFWSLPEPIDQTSDYDRVIAMLEMSVDDIIVLTSQEFDCYVMDNWTWKQNVTVRNSSYLG
jgi:hypothetical protein